MQEWNTPSGFLQWGGLVLIVVGIAGFFVLGPTPAESLLGERWWFSTAENAAYLIVGTIALIFSFGIRHHGINTGITLGIGALAMVATVAALWAAPSFFQAPDAVLLGTMGVVALMSGVQGISIRPKRSGLHHRHA